mmetsp:Transcript_17751/g.32056  ORF Transcript_17751/g.32056 Transcript_17751/m.32056 type:complete len:245 (+) Transcript_17751:11444-12178(+)
MASLSSVQASKVAELVLVYYGDPERAFEELKGGAVRMTGLGLVTSLSKNLHIESSAATAFAAEFLDRKTIEKQEFLDVFAKVHGIQIPEQGQDELFPVWEHVKRLLGQQELRGPMRKEELLDNEADWEIHSYIHGNSFEDYEEPKTKADSFNVSVPSIAEIKQKLSTQPSTPRVSRSPQVRLLFPQITSPRYLTAMQELKATYMTAPEDHDRSIFATKDPVEILQSSPNSSRLFNSSMYRSRFL